MATYIENTRSIFILTFWVSIYIIALFYSFRDSGGMVGFCARRAQRALFQTHSALTDAVFYTKILGSKSPDFFGNFAADFGHAFDKDSKIVLKN